MDASPNAVTAAERFACHVIESTYEQLPAAAIAAAKSVILDSLGVAVAGAAQRAAATLGETAERWGRADEASVLGSGRHLPAPAAALVNGFQIHCQEFDCVHEGAVVHPMATVLAASLAFAERKGGVTGRELLLAVTLGVDVAVSLGVASRAAMRFFRPATAGAFGAVAALGCLAGLGVPELVNAFGILLGQVSGTMQPHAEGKAMLPVQIGFNARNAIVAVDLAAAGIEGPREVFEGRFGYLPLFEGEYDLAPALAALGKLWRVAELSHKPFPSGRATHGGIDALLQLRASTGFELDDIARVTIHAPPLVVQLVGRPLLPDPSPSFARLCLPYVGAVALLNGSVGLDDFRAPRLTDPTVHTLASRIAVMVEGTADKNALLPQRVTVRLASGMTHEIRLDAVLGSPARPLTRQQRLAKFRTCWRAGPPGLTAERCEALARMVERLESVADVAALVALATL
ncbi:MAG: MmgE/PrpD family protein [Alphaproteobacteria bacterium]